MSATTIVSAFCTAPSAASSVAAISSPALERGIELGLLASRPQLGGLGGEGELLAAGTAHERERKQREQDCHDAGDCENDQAAHSTAMSDVMTVLPSWRIGS